ncbi:Pfs, NACHT and Ankyrin domain protein [Candidatus Moduliflexus flocculans]|uniref:Pfs, NACHT and Ankyrin domain protein n=1 Tax=Candidatus Moduliflexus flocculans TaxID=1499966 RepID=A0A0S6VVE8_9BACT|nr:Pfs, NACHT and Ankyrin domain protein [Candidatus Moduliflexus flocculans]
MNYCSQNHNKRRACFWGTLIVLHLMYIVGCSKNLEKERKLLKDDLFFAAWNGNTERTEAILAKSSAGDINARDQYEATPLMYAAYKNHPGVVGILLKHNADPNMQDHLGLTPLMQAVKYNHSPESTRVLLLHGVDLEMKDRSGTTALIFAASNGNPLIMRLLIAHGASVNVKNASGLTPLMVAAQMGHYEAIRQLLLAGADVRPTRFDGDALDFAKRQGNAEIIALLRVFGAVEPLPFGLDALLRL